MTIRTYWVHVIIAFCATIVGVSKASTSSINELYGNLIKSNLNVTVDPCDDFYAYSCGNWHTNYNGTEFIDMPGYLDHKVNQQLKALMENITQLKWQTGVYKKARDLYDSCRHLDMLVLNPFLQVVHKELNIQWPIFAMDQQEEGTWKNSSNFDWLKTVAVLKNYGLNFVFISQNVNVNPRNSSEFFVEISQHLPTSPLDPQDVANIFTNFGLEAHESETVTRDLIEFEMRLNSLVKFEFAHESENVTYADNFQYFKLFEFQNLFPNIDWLKYFQITLNTSDQLENLTIQAFVLNVEFFTNLTQLLERTPNVTMAHYLMIRFLYHINGHLPHAKPRNCIKYMRGFLSVFMDFLYEKYEFKMKRFDTEKKLNIMFNNLRHSFEEMVVENNLKLSKLEQKFILKELHTMQLKIGNLPINCTERFVDTYYKSLEISKTDFVQNHANLLQFKNRLDYEKLSNSGLSIQQKVYNLDVDSLSSSSPVKIFDNALLFPYGYLQYPLYDTKLHEAYQYSQLGFIMAHEIIHAYDLFHIIYDYASNFDWLGSQLVHHYYPKLHCYGHSPVDVLSENMADISGLRIAYNFYHSLMKNVENFPFHLNLTKEQLFFVNSVQFLCGDMGKIATIQGQLRDLTHDMHDARVRQNWSKFEEFSLAFNCSATSNMSPPETSCRLW